MARRVFFSFHYQRDVFRVNQIRNIPQVTGCAAAGFLDSSIWEDAKAKSDAAVEKLIDDGLYNTSVTVVCIGAKTAGRKFINYEIQESIDRGNGIVGVKIHHLKGGGLFSAADSAGDIPFKLNNAYTVYKYVDHDKLAGWIEQAAKDAGK